MITRRHFLQASGVAGLVSLLPGLAFAEAATDSRFVLIILRGALDGLSAVVPYGDPDYARLRREIAISAPGSGGALKLDGMFALNPSLTNLHARYRQQELIVFHAVASPYRERSHFDGQDLLEAGAARQGEVRDGWLNRAVAAMPAVRQRSSEQLAIAFAQNVPLVLRGAARVSSWAPSRLPETDTDTLDRIAQMYSDDPYFASRLRSALAADAVAIGSSNADTMQNADAGTPAPRRDPLGAFGVTIAAAGRMLRAEDGPRIAVLEATGWDTHANQGADQGQLANRLAGLDAGLESLRTELGPVWNRTAVWVVTEFGRTAAVNGTHGTDHGTATCAFLVGGAVKGGRVIADWPGLSERHLYQGRDLYPTQDLRSIAKGLLTTHLKIADSALEEQVFPDSRGAKALDGLITI